MAPAPRQDRPWVIVDSDAERLRLLEEAYLSNPNSLIDEDLYELQDLRDPSWALLESSRTEKDSEQHENSLFGNNHHSATLWRSDDTSPVTIKLKDEEHHTIDQSEQTPNVRQDGTVCEKESNANECPDTQSEDMPEDLEMEVVKQSIAVPLDTDIPTTISRCRRDTEGPDLSKYQISMSSESRAAKKRAASCDDHCDAPQRKIQRIEKGATKIVAGSISAADIPTISSKEESINETDDQSHLSSKNTIVLYKPHGWEINVRRWLEASHDYIPALFISALILHLYTRNI